MSPEMTLKQCHRFLASLGAALACYAYSPPPRPGPKGIEPQGPQGHVPFDAQVTPPPAFLFAVSAVLQSFQGASRTRLI